MLLSDKDTFKLISDSHFIVCHSFLVYIMISILPWQRLFLLVIRLGFQITLCRTHLPAAGLFHGLLGGFLHSLVLLLRFWSTFWNGWSLYDKNIKVYKIYQVIPVNLTNGSKSKCVSYNISSKLCTAILQKKLSVCVIHILLVVFTKKAM